MRPEAAAHRLPTNGIPRADLRPVPVTEPQTAASFLPPLTAQTHAPTQPCSAPGLLAKAACLIPAPHVGSLTQRPQAAGLLEKTNHLDPVTLVSLTRCTSFSLHGPEGHSIFNQAIISAVFSGSKVLWPPSISDSFIKLH